MNWGRWNRGPTIGRGATATVSLAAAPDSDVLFAVKSMELKGSAPLQREKEILSGLDSPHVVSYLGFDVTSAGGRECYNLFMEYAPGGSLAEEIKRHGGKLDEIGIRVRAREILMGLAYLHANGVAHCDIKGENIVIGVDGKAKIADLGCAKELGDCSDRRIRGTPAFMAPEVARGEAQGPEADIWALGCTVIQMATGKAPWLDSDPIAVLHRIAFSGESPPLPPSLSDDARDFLSRCLMKIPSERWSADELLTHPFLSSSPETHWISPKSTLDKDVWDSLTDDDEEEEEEEESPARDPSLESPAERLGVLFTEFSGSPNWTWDENWMPVRSLEIIEEEEEELEELMVIRDLINSLDLVNCDLEGIKDGEEEEMMMMMMMDDNGKLLLTCVNYDLDLLMGKRGKINSNGMVLFVVMQLQGGVVVVDVNVFNGWVCTGHSLGLSSHHMLLLFLINNTLLYIYLFCFLFNSFISINLAGTNKQKYISCLVCSYFARRYYGIVFAFFLFLWVLRYSCLDGNLGSFS